MTFEKMAAITSVASSFRPKATGSEDRTLKIWDVASGTCKATLAGHRYLCLFPPYSCVVCIAVAVYALCTVTGGEA